MKTKHKGLYEPPTSSVVEMNMQGVLCWSDYSMMWFMNSTTSDQWSRDGYAAGTSGGDGNWD